MSHLKKISRIHNDPDCEKYHRGPRESCTLNNNDEE